MKDRRGSVIYVGKAKMLRSRVRSYFQRHLRLHVHHAALQLDPVADIVVAELFPRPRPPQGQVLRTSSTSFL
jgi:hypothetical protein